MQYNSADVVSEGSTLMGFPCDSVGKESACSAGDPGLIFWVGKIHCRKQSNVRLLKATKQPYFWASLIAQLVKDSPAMQETWVRSLGWEDPVEKGKATHSIFWPGEFQSMGSQRVGHN